MVKIINRDELVENAETSENRTCRDLALRCLEQAVNAVDPKRLLESKIKLEKNELQVDGFVFDLGKIKHIYVVGGGKAGGKMAQAIEEILGKQVTAGIVNVPYGTRQKTNCIELNEASHPVPDEAGVGGAIRMMELVEQAKADDLVICLISGGGSSLMTLPRKGISIEDKKAVTNSLLKCGAPITEINIVRKHLSDFKGGWLAKKAYPATILNIVLSDVMGDPLDSIASGPTVPDSSTFSDARRILEKYGLWLNASDSVQKVLSEGARGLLEETPKPNDAIFGKVYSFMIGNSRTASLAAVDYLNSKGINTLFLPGMLAGEAKNIGKELARVTRERFGVKTSGYVAVVAGGETTVTVRGKGVGGRNQELALSAALNLEESHTCIIASFSTDGIDGPTDAAGAIVDGSTIGRARKLGLDPREYIRNNDAYSFFSKLKDLICTGATGTNVNDVAVVIALKE